MQWYIRAYEDVVERISTLSPRARILAAAPLAIVLIAIIAWKNRGPTTEYEHLLGGRSFSRSEIAAIESAFASEGLNDSRVVGSQIQIPRTEKDAYLKVLATADALPGNIDGKWDDYLPENPFSSSEIVRQKGKFANQQKLARIISGMHGIESATVQFDEMKRAGFPPTIEKRAVVVVRAVNGGHLSYDQVEAIRETVTGYVSGLDRRMVTITDLNAVRAYPGDLKHQATGQSYAGTKWILEKSFREKILDRLAMYPKVVVGVNVHLQPPSSADVGPAADAADVELEQPAATQPALVTTSIDLPRSYFASLWRERHPELHTPPTAEQLREIEQEVKHNVERAIVAILPPPIPELASYSQVTVTTYDDVAGNIRPAPVSATRLPVPLPDHWQVVTGVASVAGVLLFAALVVACRRIRWSIAAGSQRRRNLAEQRNLDLENDPSPLAGGRPATNSDWQRELIKKIQQDPEAASKALKTWMRDAA